MKKTGSFTHKIATFIAAVFCVIFGLLLLFNLTIIVKGLIHSDVPPSVFGITPMVVKSGSMSSDVQHSIYASEIIGMSPVEIAAIRVGDTVYTMCGDHKVENTIVSVNADDAENAFFLVERPAADHIEVGDLILSKKIDPKELKVGDVISYLENNSVVTHRIIRIENVNGALSFITKGDANNTEDTDPVAADMVVGRFTTRIPMLGDFIYFLQKPLGMAIFIGVPVLTFIIYDIIRRSRASKKEDSRAEELEKELERLRALAGASEKDKGAEEND